MAGVNLPRIDSTKNPRVKTLVRLRERRERERSGTALVEGARELRRALEAGLRVREAFVSRPLLRDEGWALLDALAANDVATTELSEAAFDRCSVRQGPDGVLGVIEAPDIRGARPTLPDRPLVLVLAGLEKPANLGALLRTADAARVDAVVLCGDEGTDPWNPGVIRASMGSVFALALTVLTDEEARAWLHEAGVRTVATTPAAEVDYWDADLGRGCAIVLGAEHEGLSDDWLAGADVRVRVPMAGLADSLNVSVTGALLAYEARRQRRAGIASAGAGAHPGAP